MLFVFLQAHQETGAHVEGFGPRRGELYSSVDVTQLSDTGAH